MAKKVSGNIKTKSSEKAAAVKTTTTQPVSAKSSKSAEKESPVAGGFLFAKENYILMLAGIGLILLGFILMVGPGNNDPTAFNESIFDGRRITLAPIIIVLGFVLEIIAIMRKPRAN